MTNHGKEEKKEKKKNISVDKKCIKATIPLE